ncbi:MAG: O-antigen ligase family protein [Ignavibacteria bacterium]|nr:O-antigen ligase family protein [Ignavibacteria bacterium]
MIDAKALLRDNDKVRLFYIIGLIFLSSIAVISLVFELYTFVLILVAVPFVFIAFIYFQKHYLEIFLISLFLGNYFQWSFRVQLSLLAAFAVIFYFMSSDKNLFNELNLPRNIKYSGIVLVSAVYLSSFLTPFVSFFTVYYAFLFFTFVTLSYVVFRSVKDTDTIDKLLYFFVVLNSISGVIVILQIIYTGKLRSLGLALFPQMDFAAMALITVIFRNFLLSKTDNKTTFVASIVFIVLITTQSRFAWLGFLLTFIYGLIICFIYSPDARSIIKKRIPVFIFAMLIGVSLIFIFRLDNIFLQRLGSNNFTLFQGSEEGVLTTNSLESRVFIWIVAVNAFIHNPLTGVGYLMFSVVSNNYNNLPDIIFTTFVENLDAHTTLLNFLCETGIIGLSSFLVYVVSIYFLSLKAIKLSYSMATLKVSIILNLLTFFIIIHSVYSGAFTMGQNALHMHFIFGLTVANYALLAKSQKNEISYDTYNS